MSYKWIGAILVIVGCGGFGFALAANHRREVYLLRQLRRGLQYMTSELKYRLTPLPELCRLTGKETGGIFRGIFTRLAEEMDRQVLPDASDCMLVAVKNCQETVPPRVRKLLLRLGRSLGRFDLNGQLRGLEALENACCEELAALNRDQDIRLRNYQTLALCAGIALVIIFI